MTARHLRALLAMTALTSTLTACDTAPAAVTTTSPPRPTSATASTSSTPPAPGVPTDQVTAAPIDPDRPLGADQLTDAPTGLGPRFTTSDDPLPARTLGALTAAGGQALPVEATLDAFGVYGLPRPSGRNSAVMELDITASRLGGSDGTSLTTEVLYMVTSTSSIDELLVSAAATVVDDDPGAPLTVPDSDGTTGDPRCARLPIDTGASKAMSAEGCQYRADPLTDVRSIGFRRLNLLVAGPPTLPTVFADVPPGLLAAGELAGYSATFGRPKGPSQSTVQLRVDVHLDAALTGLGDGWKADGPGRWWSDTATVTVDAGTATWRASTRAQQ